MKKKSKFIVGACETHGERSFHAIVEAFDFYHATELFYELCEVGVTAVNVDYLSSCHLDSYTMDSIDISPNQ